MSCLMERRFRNRSKEPDTRRSNCCIRTRLAVKRLQKAHTLRRRHGSGRRRPRSEAKGRFPYPPPTCQVPGLAVSYKAGFLANAMATTRSFLRPGKQRGLRFADTYREGEHGRFVRQAAQIGTFGATTLLIDQPAGNYTTKGTADLVLCSVLNHGVAAGIDFGAGRFHYQSAVTPFFLSPPQSPSAFAVESDHEARLLAIPMSEVRELLGRHGLRAHDELEPLFSGGFQDPFLGSVMPQLWQTLDFQDATGALLQDSVLVTIILALKRVSGSARTLSPRVSGGLSPAMVRRATEFLLAGIEQPMGLKALAEHLDMSEFHLHRAFTCSVGCSPHRWQFLRRMEMACELLRNRELNVLEVALATGYNSPQAFARMFRRHFGCSPIDYRRAVI